MCIRMATFMHILKNYYPKRFLRHGQWKHNYEKSRSTWRWPSSSGLRKGWRRSCTSCRPILPPRVFWNKINFEFIAAKQLFPNSFFAFIICFCPFSSCNRSRLFKITLLKWTDKRLLIYRQHHTCKLKIRSKKTKYLYANRTYKLKSNKNEMLTNMTKSCLQIKKHNPALPVTPHKPSIVTYTSFSWHSQFKNAPSQKFNSSIPYKSTTKFWFNFKLITNAQQMTYH